MPDPEKNFQFPADFRDRLVKSFQESGTGLPQLVDDLRRVEQGLALKELLLAARAPNANVETLYRAFDFLTSKLLPASVVTAILMNLEPGANTDLLSDVIVAGLSPERAAHTGYASRTLTFTDNLLEETRKKFKARFGSLPLDVWQRAKHHRSRPEWCSAWAEWAKDVIDLAIIYPDAKNSIRADTLLRGMAEAAPTSTDEMLGLAATLTRVFGPDVSALAVLKNAPLGIEMRRRVEWLFSKTSDLPQDGSRPSAEIIHSETSQMVSTVPVAPATSPPGSCPPVTDTLLTPGTTLPESIRAQWNALTNSLIKFIADAHPATPVPAQDSTISKVKAEMEARAEELAKLREFVARLQNTRERDRELLEKEMARSASLAAENKNLTDRAAELERSLERETAEATKLKKRLEDDRSSAKHDLEQARMDFMTSMEMRVEGIWMQFGDAVDVVVQKKREPQLLVGPWNSLNLAFWDTFGKPGRPVKKP